MMLKDAVLLFAAVALAGWLVARLTVRFVRHRRVQRRIADACAQVDQDRVRELERLLIMSEPSRG